VSQPSKKHRIAVIPGDGIGNEVMPEGVRVLDAVGRKHGLAFEWKEFPWSCEWRKTHGRMMPEDALQTLRGYEAIYFGACGFPGVPDHVSLWEMLLPMRREFDLYVNLRPVRLMPGIEPPVKRKPGEKPPCSNRFSRAPAPTAS
jgi:tartrate dehydrogenase/decarboxylase/D-malate dehydrogenase